MSKAQTILQASLLAVAVSYASCQALMFVLERPTSDVSMLKWSAFTSSEKATVYITNATTRPIRWCGRARVTSKKGATAETNHVCATVSGYSTSVVEATYPIGSVKTTCPTKNDILSSVDWDQCDFTVTGF